MLQGNLTVFASSWPAFTTGSRGCGITLPKVILWLVL